MHMMATTTAETRLESHRTSTVAAEDANVMPTVDPHRSNVLRPT